MIILNVKRITADFFLSFFFYREREIKYTEYITGEFSINNPKSIPGVYNFCFVVLLHWWKSQPSIIKVIIFIIEISYFYVNQLPIKNNVSLCWCKYQE